MIRKSFELVKDKLFDLCYEIIWMKKWMLAGIICTGIFFFYMSYLSHQTAVIWKNIPPRNELQRVSGRLSEYDRRRGGPTSGPNRLEIIFEDGSRYYVMNSVLHGVVWSRIYDEIVPGDSMELIICSFGNDPYEPRVLEISKNGICYVTQTSHIDFSYAP